MLGGRLFRECPRGEKHLKVNKPLEYQKFARCSCVLYFVLRGDCLNLRNIACEIHLVKMLGSTTLSEASRVTI